MNIKYMLNVSVDGFLHYVTQLSALQLHADTKKLDYFSVPLN
jgi:hypothetical protein